MGRNASLPTDESRNGNRHVNLHGTRLDNHSDEAYLAYCDPGGFLRLLDRQCFVLLRWQLLCHFPGDDGYWRTVGDGLHQFPLLGERYDETSMRHGPGILREGARSELFIGCQRYRQTLCAQPDSPSKISVHPCAPIPQPLLTTNIYLDLASNQNQSNH